MAVNYYAIIERDDYEAFRRILKTHLPNTFDEWSYGREKTKAQLAALGRVVGKKIHPDAFAAYLATSGTKPDLIALDRFAEKRATEDRQVDWDSDRAGACGPLDDGC